jgi:hypothetical protein
MLMKENGFILLVLIITIYINDCGKPFQNLCYGPFSGNGYLVNKFVCQDDKNNLFLWLGE